MLGEIYGDISTALALTSTGDKYTFTPDTPVEIVRVGGIVTVAMGTTAAVVKVDKRVTAGSDTGRGDGDVSQFTIATTIAAGKGVYRDLTSRIKLLPGEEAVFQVTTAATTTGTAFLFIQYRRLPFQPIDVSTDMTEVTA